jgi:hypothetical protein
VVSEMLRKKFRGIKEVYPLINDPNCFPGTGSKVVTLRSPIQLLACNRSTSSFKSPRCLNRNQGIGIPLSNNHYKNIRFDKATQHV